MYRDGGEELLVDDNARELFVSEKPSPRTIFIPITILDSDEESPPRESETLVFADVVATCELIVRRCIRIIILFWFAFVN